MAKNGVQFQRGMSLSEFLARYGTEAQCERAVFAWRWPQGFVCPECGCAGHCLLGRGLYQCHRCHRQTSLPARTLFAGTKWALTQWLLAIYLLTQSKNGISAMDLARQVGSATTVRGASSTSSCRRCSSASRVGDSMG